MNLPWLEPAWTVLRHALEADRLGHALLLHGPAGLGKTVLADRIAARLLCLQPAATACGECRSCRLLEAGTHPDRFAIEPEDADAPIKVEAIRDLSHRMQLTARMSPARVTVIRRAERMNLNAANALLKTLEEPPAGAWLILVTDHPGRLPVTIRSRCLPVPVRPPEPGQAHAWLEAAGTGADAATLTRALDLAGGAPLAARAWIEDGDMIFGEQVLTVLAGPGRDVLDLALEWSERAASAWAWCARWTARALHVKHAGGDTGEAALEVLARRETGALLKAYDGAVAGLAAARGPGRQDLRLADWLVQWLRAAPR